MNCETVIIGAGLTGLTTAFKLHTAQKEFLVLEQADRVGGVIRSQEENGFLYEGGPNSGVMSNVELVQLFDGLKGKCELEVANQAAKRRYVLKGGKWSALPSGPLSAITTPLFSLADKFKVLGEPFRKPGTNPHETLAAMVKRRLGQSFLDYAIDPFVLGIYAGDPNRLIPKYAFPKLYNLEQNYGSFIKGAVKKGKEPKTELEKRVTREVFSVKGGLQNLTDALFQEIGNEQVVLEALNINIYQKGDEYEVVYQKNGTLVSLFAKNIITTTGAYALPDLLPFVAEAEMEKIANLHHTRVIELQIGFNDWKGRSLDGFGGLIPFKEKRDILGVMFMSAFVSGRAPKNGALFAIFVGGVRRQDMFEKSDEEVKEIALKEFGKLMQTSQKPDMVKMHRYQKAIPQYYEDSGERFNACERIEAKYPNLFIGGNLRDGIGMADRVQQAFRLAEKIKSTTKKVSSVNVKQH